MSVFHPIVEKKIATLTDGPFVSEDPNAGPLVLLSEVLFERLIFDANKSSDEVDSLLVAREHKPGVVVLSLDVYADLLSSQQDCSPLAADDDLLADLAQSA